MKVVARINKNILKRQGKRPRVFQLYYLQSGENGCWPARLAS